MGALQITNRRVGGQGRGRKGWDSENHDDGEVPETRDEVLLAYHAEALKAPRVDPGEGAIARSG